MIRFILLILIALTSSNADDRAIEKCASSVVQIHIKHSTGESVGSGIILDTSGYIITNEHVIENADVITITLPNSYIKHTANLIGSDKDTDIALIKIDSKNLHPASIAKLLPTRGEKILTVGYPFHNHQSISRGIVSAVHVYGVDNVKYESYIEIDANVNHGNSGGALCNAKGELIGMNSASFKGFGFSIEIDKVLSIINVLKIKGKFQRNKLGISVEDSMSCKGTAVINVNKNSNSFKNGDCIIGLNNIQIDSAASLFHILGFYERGTELSFSIIRDEAELVILK